MEALIVIMGLLGLAKDSFPQRPQPIQQYYNPQTGKYYIYYNGYMYEQTYQNQTPQNLATPYGTPQPSNGQWYPQQPAQTAANPQGYYR